MIRPGTFERVYAAIRKQLREGAFRPGDRLEPAILSKQLYASVTPVRDALHRLAVERLVEALLQKGFRMPVLTENALRHLYAWHHDLLLLAVLNRRPEPGLDALGVAKDDGAQDRQRALFLALAESTGNPEHVLALENIADRLEPVQRLEALLLDAVEEETGEIVAAIEANDRKALRRALLHYHRRRLQIVPELLERLQQA